MKRKIILGFVIFMILTCFLGCSNPSAIPAEEHKVQLYKVESGLITNQTYEAAMNTASNWTELSYSKIASVRGYLYDNTIPSSHEIITGISLNEIKEFLLQHNSSNYEAECIIENLKEVGNNIVFFEYAYDDDKKVWAYATK